MKLVIPAVFTAVDKFSGPLSKMQNNVGGFANKIQNAGSTAMAVGRSTALFGLALAAPLIVATKAAVEFEDKMADVAKTTGLTGKTLDTLGKSLVDYSTTTRTSIDDLLKITEIGGQLGIVQKDLLSFTKAADKFNVALGADFGSVDEAVTQVGKIKQLFKDTRGLDVSASIMKTGSAINELGAMGAGTSANISDFTLRMGQLPDALKGSVTDTLALGTYLEELGINAEIGSGGLTRMLLVAGQKIDKFAVQMEMSSIEAKKLLSQNPTEFAKKFAVSFKGLKPEVLAQKLEKLGIGTQETIKVIGALGSNMDRLTELQKYSNDSFTKGTSLQNEYNTKNKTTAAQMAKLKNTVKALTLEIGQAMLPIVKSLADALLPVIRGISKWMKDNPKLTEMIVKVTAAVAAFAFAVSGIAFAIGTYQKAVALAETAQWAFNAAMAANPIGLIVAGIIATIALIVQVIRKWDEWGAAVALFMGPIGLVIALIMSLRKHWTSLVNVFKTDGIIAGFKRLGLVILDALLYPMQQFLKLISKIPGLGYLAGTGADKIQQMRNNLLPQESNISSGLVSANPDKAKNDSNLFNMTEIIKQSQEEKSVKIEFTGLPEWMKPTVSSSTNKTIPKTSKTSSRG
jgi:hypothetical protein